MTTVRQILQRKVQHDFFQVPPETSVFDTLQLMAEKNIGAVLVMEKGELLGIFSERDYARRVVLRGLSSASTPVRAIMSERVLYVSPDDSIETCMLLMTDQHIRHLPVLDPNRNVLGLVSIGDVVSSIISQQQFTIEQLERYIQQ